MQTLDEGCAINFVPETDGDQHKRLLVRVAIPMTDGVYQPTVHYDCLENQVQAIHNRVCGVVPKATDDGINLMRSAVQDLVSRLRPTSEDNIYDLAERNTGRKARRYRDAADAYLVCGVNNSDANIKMFVKAERFNPDAKVNPDPRAIQFRGAVYCVALAQYLRPIEEQLYLFKHASDGVPRTRNVAKGLNSVARAELLVAKAGEFDDPVFVGGDASRYDKHIGIAHLKLEHSVYLSCNSSKEFAELLGKQFKNRCFSSLGLKYTTSGRRMSGDMNTAIGNIVIMLAMLIAFFRYSLKLPKWDCIDDGDDWVAIVERRDLDMVVKSLESVFLTFGMTMKVEAAVSKLTHVEFCQSRMIEYQPGRWKFVRNFRDVFSKGSSGVRNWMDPVFRTRVINSVGTCELVLGLGVPVLQAYAQALLRNTRGVSDPLRYVSDGLRARTLRDAKLLGIEDIRGLTAQPILPCARESFADAFGIEEATQIKMEEWLDSWAFRLDHVKYVGSEWQVEGWENFQSLLECYRVMA